MHIPDGFLDGKTAAALGVISATALGVALRQARRNLPPRRVPLMGLAGAFIFAAQMLNFPVAGGTSGHLVGGVLAAALLGPSAAFIVICAVLILQALLFADGGIVAMGANVFNMGLISAVGGWVVYAAICKMLIGGKKEHGAGGIVAPGDGLGGDRSTSAQAAAERRASSPATRVVGDAPRGSADAGSAGVPQDERRFVDGTPMPKAELRARLIAAAFASWLVIVLAAIACAAELALSGTIRWSLVFPAMTHVHMLIGIGEGLITALVLLAVAQTRPELIQHPAAAPARGRYGELVIYGLLISLGLALFVSPFASKWPDGLDRTSEKLAFNQKQAQKPVLPAAAPAYKFPGIGSATLATSAAGAVGTALAFGLSVVLARVLVPKEKE